MESIIITQNLEILRKRKDLSRCYKNLCYSNLASNYYQDDFLLRLMLHLPLRRFYSWTSSPFVPAIFLQENRRVKHLSTVWPGQGHVNRRRDCYGRHDLLPFRLVLVVLRHPLLFHDHRGPNNLHFGLKQINNGSKIH